MEGGEEEPSTLGTVWYYAWEYGLEVVPVAAPTRGFLRAYDEGSTLGMGLSAVELGLDLSGIGPLARGGKFAVKGTVRGIGKVASEVKPLASTAIDVAKTKAGQAYSFAKSKAGDAATWMSETSDSVAGGLAGAANWMYSGAAGFFGRGKRHVPVNVLDNRSTFKFSGAIRIDGLREATHADIVKAFDGSGFSLTNHFITRIKDPRLDKLGVRTFKDLESIFRNGVIQNADDGAIAIIHNGVAIIMDPLTNCTLPIPDSRSPLNLT